ncbi:GNAT family N-acetyltransferase [Fusobacterium polymorphum]|jgi:possible acetyltransferase|uniref:GNAT family N-acetyltransferase n=1 Tax=Fusobacterium nucleatum TaxID=851 RepID=A0A323TU34_FUSNU|nr:MULTISPECIES: GNAT family N-acetyltransferase [Fusobacterium]HCE32253.1 N-acetyltransferase [Fusobacterium sp.]PCR86053.1 GNAT family N-acetyltransferase [Fusobacterium nucleatum]PZA04091.1 GNAT family N-acetyltransferase [Fusobacterium nucleatum]QJX49841.1 GNAT family N-acetyltransferase [Fusobacterium nucleatum]QYR61674.1 GNAT family N-acetyltransferase [Fusobacterium polymorphum]
MDMIKLISVNNDELKNEALNVYLENNYYFSKISDNPPSISNVEEDIEVISNGVQKNQKNYRLISFNDEILGVVDFLSDYPEKDTILIGLFIIKNDKQKQGLGTKIFRYLEKSFKNKKFLKIRIGVLANNEIGLSFWKKQNFKEIERKFLKFEKSKKEVIVMEKEI